MYKYLTVLSATALLVTCNAIPTPKVQVVKFDTVQHLMTRESDKIEVINFWATWCKPCIKELPYFQALQNTQPDKVNVTLISLDFVDVLNEKVIPFVERRQLTPQVLLLDEIDYNSWIDKVDPSWSGAIPATLIINHKTGQRRFLERELKTGELEQIIKQLTI
jgi:thiol-disulfide isomerase/thioredoxin